MQNKEYYGNETRKAVENFGIGSIPFELVRAYTEVKKACIKAIQEHEKRFGESIYVSIIKSIDLIIMGKYNEEFVVPLEQGGAGTSINMNINEVIASLASEIFENDFNKKIILNPIEDINRHQSTNDTFPTAVTILLLRKLIALEKKIIELQETLIKKETEYQNILIAGRTEMQDALPITLGQVFGSWAGSIERDRWRLNKIKERLRTIALGGTAIGTCFFAPKDYVYLAEKHLREITGLPLSRSQNLPDEIANHDKLSELAGGLSLAAQNLFKISGDLLLYTSSMISEIHHPVLQIGSTIMAAKTNPVILEFVRGLSIEVQHECNKISTYTQNGQLQLNPYIPFAVKSFLNAFESLERAIDAIIKKFFNIMDINYIRIEENLLNSKVLLNSLVAVLGYDKTKEIDKIIGDEKPVSIEHLKNIISENSHLGKKAIDDFFNPLNLTSFFKDKIK